MKKKLLCILICMLIVSFTFAHGMAGTGAHLIAANSVYHETGKKELNINGPISGIYPAALVIIGFILFVVRVIRLAAKGTL